MPIQDIRFEDDIVFSRATGQIDRPDADKWGMAVQHYVEKNQRPIFALIDALEVGFVATSARLVFARMSQHADLLGVVVVTQNPIAVQSFRVTGMLGQQGHTYIFPNLDEAKRFAEDKIQGINPP